MSRSLRQRLPGGLRRSRLDPFLAGGLALLALVLQPALHAALRGDDTWTYEARGESALFGRSFLEHVGKIVEDFWTGGRPNYLGGMHGALTTYLFDDHPVAYRAYLIAMTLVAAAVLYALVRELGLSRGAGLLVCAVLAGAIQFRSWHDAVLGYAGFIQLLLALVLGSLLLLVRGLRTGDRRLLLAAFLLFLPCPLLYEGAYTLCAAHLGVALLERRGRRAVLTALPYLALGVLFVLFSLIGRSQGSAVAQGYEVGGSLVAAIRTYVVQLFAPIPVSNLFFRADAGAFLTLGSRPTPAELAGGAWRGLAVGGVVLAVLLRTALPEPRALRAMAVIGGLLWTSAVLALSFSPKYQVEIIPGRGHLPALIQVFGWALVAGAGVLAVQRSARGRSVVAARCTALGVAALIGIAAGVVGYANLRTVAVEQPVRETRQLLETGLSRGAVDAPAGATLLFTPRDLQWPTGNLGQVPAGLESLLIDRSGRRYDARLLGAPLLFECPATGTYPPGDCERPLQEGTAAWVRIRARPGGGSVIQGHVRERRLVDPFAVTVDRLRVYVQATDGEPQAPLLIGQTLGKDGWTSEGLTWRMAESGDGWAIFEADVPAQARVLASSLDDSQGKFDFFAPLPPDDLARVYGTRRLLP